MAMRNVDRGVQGQKDFREHPPIEPVAAAPGPEVRSLPEPRFDELQILAIGDFIFADGEGRNVDAVLVEFVIPTKFAGCLAERGVAGGDFDHCAS